MVIYITGHRNPDADSICSALAYANLKSIIDPANDYIPVRCSKLSDGLKSLLEQLNIAVPQYMRDVYPKIGDVMITTGLKMQADDSLTNYASLYEEKNPPVVPVFENGEYFGLLSVDDVMDWSMKSLAAEGCICQIPTVRDLMRDSCATVRTTDLFEEAKILLSASKKRGLAVVDESGRFAGYVTRRCFLNTPRYNVIMVDHNEATQSIRGIESANVVEVIDHHRLNALKTDLPLFIDAEPLGSTCTIVYQLFQRNGIRPFGDIARILLTGILADTLILKSPTTTRTDHESAAILSAICGLPIEEYGRQMFSHVEGLSTRKPEDAIKDDFKDYMENGVRFGIGQCEVTTLKDINQYAANYLKTLEDVRRQKGLDWALLMITDVLKERSVLLSTDYKSEAFLPYAALSRHLYDMPEVMSRKKQLLPEIIHTLNG